MEITVFVSGEGEEPVTLTGDQLDGDVGVSDDYYSVRDLFDDMGLHVQTYDLYSAYSILNAVWALQQIAAGDSDAHRIARKALAEIAISGDFEERVIEDEDGPTGFTLPPVFRADHKPYGHTFDWK